MRAPMRIAAAEWLMFLPAVAMIPIVIVHVTAEDPAVLAAADIG